MYHNIPLELQELNQWVCWRYEEVNGRRTKVPYCPSLHNAVKASIHNPGTWGTFQDAVNATRGPTMDGIGLVLTEDDPYTGIDIDDKKESPASEAERVAHIRILEAFRSYTECSVGERWTDEQGRERGGYHIIIKGKINGGRDRGHVGVYSTARYLTFSGHVVRNAPIEDYQELLLQLIAEMPASEYHGELDEVEGHLTDVELHDMALRAENGEKYAQLTRGEWAELGYPSASEADLALISIIAYYTRDNEQVRRMFRFTVLGKREKHTGSNRWIDRCLKRARSQQPSSGSIEEARATAERLGHEFDSQPVQASTDAEPKTEQAMPAPAAPSPPPAPAPAHAGSLNAPPGLVGELSRYFHSTAVRPLKEAALTAAIGIVAGVVGRTYNISGTGLNQYILFLGKTGTGKEGIAKGIAKLMAAVRNSVPMVDDFIGPSAFASGQGLIRTLDARPCFVSMLGEFGLTLQALSDPRAPAAMTILRKVLLDLYSKSGWEDVLQSTAYSDVEKNTKIVRAPNVTILAESTPETFYEGISISDIADGLIPRFHVVEYTGKRTPRNRSAGMPPPPALVQQFANLCSVALTSQNNGTCSAVQINAEALMHLDAFDAFCDEAINNAVNPGESQLWNRAHLKALKLAGLLAVGCNPHAPMVTVELAQWAIEFTKHGTQQVLSKFNLGEVGTGESKQFSDVRRIIEEFFKFDAKQLKSYQCKPEVQAAGLVPYRYLVQRLVRLAAFTHDKRGGTNAVRSVLETMVQMGMLSAINPEISSQRFGTRQLHYALTQQW